MVVRSVKYIGGGVWTAEGLVGGGGVVVASLMVPFIPCASRLLRRLMPGMSKKFCMSGPTAGAENWN